MLHLLKIEWLKLKNYRTFWILSLLLLVSLFGINYIAYEIQANRPKDPLATTVIGSPFAFPEVWHTVTYMSSFLLFIPGVLMIIFITNEFSFKTHRQNVIDGLSRTQFVLTKMMIAALLALATTLVVFLTAALFGLSAAEASFTSTGMEYIGYFFIQALSYIAVALLFALLLRRSGIAIGIYFLYIIVLENMLAGLLDRYASHTGTYLPLQTTDSLIPFPFFRNITEQLNLYKPDPAVLLSLSFIYLAAYFIIGKRRFETVDL